MAVCVGFVSCFPSQMSNIKIHLLRNLLLQHHTEAKSVYLKSKWHPKCQLCLFRINSISKIGHSISTTYIKLLKKIVDAIILCGKQNIPLRGHRDDTTNKGNFLAILQMMSNSGLIYQKQIRTPYIPAKPFRMRLSNSLEITSQVKFWRVYKGGDSIPS